MRHAKLKGNMFSSVSIVLYTREVAPLSSGMLLLAMHAICLIAHRCYMHLYWNGQTLKLVVYRLTIKFSQPL